MLAQKFRSLFILFSILFLISSCEREYSFENGGTPGAGSSSGTAVYTFNGGTGNCTGAVISGDYTVGTAVTSANKVSLSVIVTTAGTYSLTTITSNGISFSGSGNFTASGAQTITLTATGTPTNTGTFTYVPGTSGCSFSINVVGASSNNNCKDCVYVPLCVGSLYVYNDTTNTLSGDVINEINLRYASAIDTTVDGLVYKKMVFASTQGGTTNNSISYNNCNNGVSTAFSYGGTTMITGSIVGYNKITPLKANEALNATWNETIYNGAGQPATNTYTMAEKGITRTVGTTNFSDVIHVTLVQTMEVSGSTITTSTGDYYYARGVGLIDCILRSEMSGTVLSTYHRAIKSYQIP
jgi:hypothetical protein